MIKIIFIKDFATRKKGDVWECDGQLAATLIAHDKVAEVYTEKSDKKDIKKAK